MRSFLYFLARLLGDFNAASRGPEAVAKRMERRVTGRLAGKILRRIFR